MTAARCARCESALDATGRCPGIAPLLRVDGREYGTAQQLVHRLGPDITVAMVRNWAARDGLPKARMIGDDGRPEVRHPLDQAAQIERDKRLAKEKTGRGRPRRLDIAVAPG